MAPEQDTPAPREVYILPAEYVGEAIKNDDGTTTLPLDLRASGCTSIFIRRYSHTLAIAEIAMASHDGLAQEELDRQNDEAEHHPLGAKEYWRAEMVGKYTYGSDGHLMTDDEFEADWAEDE